jgi:hypothetical protein
MKPYLLKNLAEQRYETPTSIQMQSVPCLLSNREILVCAPTGSGKTLSFALPILHCLQKPKKEQTRAVVVCPTKELAKQTHRVFTELGKGKPWKVLLTTKGVVHYPDFASAKNGIFMYNYTYHLDRCYGHHPYVSVRNDQKRLHKVDQVHQLRCNVLTAPLVSNT